jgi:hypothetical protein
MYFLLAQVMCRRGSVIALSTPPLLLRIKFFAFVSCRKEWDLHKRWGKKAPIGGDNGPCQNDGLDASLDDYDGLGDMPSFRTDDCSPHGGFT